MNPHNESANESVDIKDLVLHVWSKRFQYLISTIIVAVFAVIILLLRPNMYTSQMLLVPVNKEGSSNMLQGLAGQFGGLANLAGINLGATGNDENIIAKQTLRSRAFLLEAIKDNSLEAKVYAAYGIEKGKIVYDTDLYDEASKQWNKDALDGHESPTDTQLYEQVMSYYSVVENTEDGTIELSFEHVSPEFSMKFLLIVFDKINHQMRARALEKSKNRLDYLMKESETATVASVRQVLAQLVETEINKKLLIDTEPHYSFDVVDPAFVPDEKSSPMRAVILILVLFGHSLLFISYCGVSFLLNRSAL